MAAGERAGARDETEGGDGRAGGARDDAARRKGRESAARKLREHGDELRREGAAMAASARGAAEELSRFTRSELERSPYLTLGATFAVGFVLGGGIPPRLLAAVTALGARVAVASLMREVATGTKAGFEGSGEEAAAEA